MKAMAIIPLSVLFLATPTLAADLDHPGYCEREYVPAPRAYDEPEYIAPPPVVERRVVERVYVEPEIYYRRPVYGYGYYAPYPYRPIGWGPGRGYYSGYSGGWCHHGRGW